MFDGKYSEIYCLPLTEDINIVLSYMIRFFLINWNKLHKNQDKMLKKGKNNEVADYNLSGNIQENSY